MYPSIFSDELGKDVTEGLPIIKSWGLEAVDFRGRVLGKAIHALSGEELKRLRELVDSLGMRVGVIQSSLAKVHLPDAERRKEEAAKLEGIIRAADALDCRVVRSFHYWQPKEPELKGALAVRPDELQKVLDMFEPLAARAKSAGLLMTFENCGVTPYEVFAVLDALGEPAWGLAWDVYNGWAGEERKRDEDAYVKQMAHRARIVHVKARGAVAELGGEVIPYDKVLGVCDAAGHIGAVSVETHNPDRTVDNTEMSRRVAEILKKAWPTAAPGFVGEREKDATGVRRAWEDKPVGFVVVGLGMGHGRSKMIASTPGAKLVGVCDLNVERARRTGEELGVPYSTDLKDWLGRDEVEAVFVLTSSGSHGTVALQALEAGKHVLTTKPMDATVEACDQMIRKAEEKGLVLGVDFGRRFSDRNAELKRAVAEGALGRLLQGTCFLKVLRTMEYFTSSGGWRGTVRWDGGGALSNQAIHHIDEIAYAVGIPSRVRCDIWTQNHEIEGEDLGTAAWEYQNGLVVVFSATTCFPQKTWYYHFELHGTEGAYHKSGGGFLEREEIRWFINEAWRDRAPVEAACEWVNAVDNFAAAVRTGAPLVCSGRDGRRTQAILEAMYRSARASGGAWVEVRAELPEAVRA